MSDAIVNVPFELIWSDAPRGGAGPDLELEIYRGDGTSVLEVTGTGITEPRPRTYRLEATLDVSGHYLYRWTDPVAVEFDEGELDVASAADPAAAPPATLLATVDDLKRHLRTTGATGTSANIPDELLEDFLEAASSRMQEERPERTLAATPVNDAEPPLELRFRASRFVQVPDLREATEVRFDDEPLEAASYRLIRRRPGHPALWLSLTTAGTGLELGREELVIVGRWGPADSPTLAPKPSVRHAAIVWAARAFHNRTARYADTVSTPDGGVAAYFRQLPPDVLATVNALQVPGL